MKVLRMNSKTTKRVSLCVAPLVLALLLTGCGGFGVADNTAAHENEQQSAVETAATSAQPEVKTETESGDEGTTEPEAEERADAPSPTEGEVNREASTTAKQPAPSKTIGNNTSKNSTNSSQKLQPETQKPETSPSTTAPSSNGTSGGGGNSDTPIIGVIGSGGQSSGGADQPQGGGVIGGQQIHVHSYSRQVVEPTCSEGGYTVFTCSCGESYTGNYTSATGQHRWVMDYDYVPVYEERAICVCNVCGKDVTDITLKEHYFNDGCPGGWHSETLRVEVGTSYEVVGCHCEDCGKIRGE